MNDITLPNGENIQCLDELTAVYVYNEIYVENVYLSHGISIKEGDTILDIGANIGLFSKYIANQAPNLKIYTFEPVPVIFNVLEKNLTNLPAKVKNYNIGLADETGEIDFFYYPKVCADSAAVQFDWEYKVNKYVENYKEAICKNMPIARIVPKFLRKFVVRTALKRIYSGEKVICKLRTLSDIIKENDIKKIDLLKLDAENYEKQVLAGIKEDDWDKIQQLAIEVHTHITGGRNLLKEIIELLESKKFKTEVGEESRESIMGVYMLYAKRD